MSFKYKRPPHFRVFCYGYKGEVEEEVKGRTTSIFSVAMLQNLNDYYPRDQIQTLHKQSEQWK